MTPPHRIEAEKITKPMQLLAAWLIGLIIVDSTFLVGATQMALDSWERGALVVAAIVNVPVFLCALFLLQTRFRPELQEDSYYAQYLDRRTNQVVTVSRDDVVERELATLRSEVRLLSAESDSAQVELLDTPSRGLKVGLNTTLDDFNDLRQALKNRQIPLFDIFGADDPPQERAIAFARRVSFQDKVRMLKFAVDNNFTGYNYISFEEDIEEDVLIGSYGDTTFPISRELGELLEKQPEPVDLRAYEKRRLRSRRP